ncbi:hypothetical protein NPIL_442561 [Nephila pilipes]|uniref:Uncharacterized protein n=1 Tax=Nephila pilipes TaxID=299642 RepID=A0A8X6JIR6_NEPPI|nr:hypothetical protein NPIL_442561 [Nephila pilipes]
MVLKFVKYSLLPCLDNMSRNWDQNNISMTFLELSKSPSHLVSGSRAALGKSYPVQLRCSSKGSSASKKEAAGVKRLGNARKCQPSRQSRTSHCCAN